jgi:hypothetical protein
VCYEVSGSRLRLRQQRDKQRGTIGPITGTSFTDVNAVSGTTYYYVIKATNGSTESAPSTEISATALQKTVPPLLFSEHQSNPTNVPRIGVTRRVGPPAGLAGRRKV